MEIIDVEKEEKCLTCYLPGDSKEEDIDIHLVHLFNYLSDMFNNKNITFWIRPFRIITSHFLFSNLHFESCKFLKIVGEEHDILSNDGVSRLLEVLKPTVGITLNCRVEEGFQSRSHLSLSRLLVTNGKWFSFDDLLKIGCEVACFKNHSFTEEDVKKFINHWMDGSNPKLMHLRLHGFNLTPNWENILEGIEVWDEGKSRRPKSFKIPYVYRVEEINCQNGLDFKRRTDGKIGTVMHQSGTLDFLVWYDLQA
ncbi:hypothetical protein CRE_02027 [Caenorhabditis remanei]|uniref:Sdz-33 F-box domain-containing protein n=1 Tax=Caenorhabditis remanei TaxID=31234 RepID=E3LGW7_CAERE|nr:hypothetical protein CRE_02027 [Caenorhabditis remanei]